MAGLGTDVEETERRPRPVQARDSGQAIISGQLALHGNDSVVRDGLMMLMPVYRNGQPTATLAERRANIAGWVFARFITAQLDGRDSW